LNITAGHCAHSTPRPIFMSMHQQQFGLLVISGFINIYLDREWRDP
jgi:hypothetical protein